MKNSPVVLAEASLNSRKAGGAVERMRCGWRWVQSCLVANSGMGSVRLLAILCLGVVAGWLPVSARAERVLNLTGTGQLLIPALSQLRFGASNDFSVELWMKPANTGSEIGAVFTSDSFGALTGSGTNGGWGLYWQSGGIRVARKPSISAVNANPLGGSPGTLVSIGSGAWHHVAVNFKKTEKMTFYVDGVLQETTTDAFNSWAYFQRTFDSYLPFRIGSDPGGTNVFKGSVDEVRIWGRVRTATEIQSASQQRTGLSGTEPGLLAYYRFSETAGDALSLGSLGSTANAPLGTGPTRVEDTALTIAAAPAAATDFALTFNGSNQYVETQVTGERLAGDELTIEYWFKGSRLLSAVRLQAGDKWVVSGWGPPGQAPQNIINTTGTNNLAMPITTTVPGVQDGLWHHVALTWKRNTVGGFKTYLDGLGGSSGLNTSDHPFPVLDAKVILGSLNGGSEFLLGTLDEVRIWNRALPPDEIRDHFDRPARLLGTDPGLVAYFNFNDISTTGTLDVVGKQLALFKNMSGTERVVQDGKNFSEPVIRALPNPTAAGLWLGEVSLRQVNEVYQGAANPTNVAPAGGPFEFNVILHADAAGTVNLLKDVTLMQRRAPTSNFPELVLVTDDTLLPNFEGVLKRGGKMVGARYSSAFYTFPGTALPMAGGIGFAYRMVGTNAVPSSSSSSPFRHRFHPTHKNPTDLQGNPYDVTREIEIILTGGGKLQVNEGRDRLKGLYRETFRGLHKAPLIAEGEISLERISLVNKLNDR